MVIIIGCNDENGEQWCVVGHNEFEDVEEGELPNGVTGEEIWDALGVVKQFTNCTNI